MNNGQFSTDFTLRIRAICHILYDVCRCHLFTDPRNRCSRCDVLTSAATEWEYEYQLCLEAYNAEKAKRN